MAQRILVLEGGDGHGKTILANMFRDIFGACIITSLLDPIPDGTELVVYDSLRNEYSWKRIQEIWKSPIVIRVKRMELNSPTEWLNGSKPTWKFKTHDRKFIAKPMTAFFLNYDNEPEAFVHEAGMWFGSFRDNDYKIMSRSQ